jgi:hypothetical protein
MQELNGLEDTISWRWTADEQYSASSAYKIQFSSNHCKMKICPIWKAKAEPKCRFVLGPCYIREFRLSITFRKGVDLALQSAVSATQHQKQFSTYARIAPLVERCGAKLCLGPTFFSWVGFIVPHLCMIGGRICEAFAADSQEDVSTVW